MMSLLLWLYVFTLILTMNQASVFEIFCIRMYPVNETGMVFCIQMSTQLTTVPEEDWILGKSLSLKCFQPRRSSDHEPRSPFKDLLSNIRLHLCAKVPTLLPGNKSNAWPCFLVLQLSNLKKKFSLWLRFLSAQTMLYYWGNGLGLLGMVTFQ